LRCVGRVEVPNAQDCLEGLDDDDHL
jgi:hypothetical protein